MTRDFDLILAFIREHSRIGKHTWTSNFGMRPYGKAFFYRFCADCGEPSDEGEVEYW